MNTYTIRYIQGGYTEVRASSFAEAETKGIHNGAILSITLK